MAAVVAALLADAIYEFVFSSLAERLLAEPECWLLPLELVLLLRAPVIALSVFGDTIGAEDEESDPGPR